ncbi:MAG: hypothetical protein WDA47_00360 [Bacilli bacterium]
MDGLTRLTRLFEELSITDRTVSYIKNHLTASNVLEITPSEGGALITYMVTDDAGTKADTTPSYGHITVLLRGTSGGLRMIAWDIDGVSRLDKTVKLSITDLEELIRG